jgi:hypothetical protein
MNRLNKWLLWVIVVLVVILVILVAWQVFFARSQYSAVYLRTGEVYFGKLVRFPYFGLKNVYSIQATGDQQNPLRIQRFTDSFWGPEDRIKINRDEVVWYTELKNESQLNQLFATNPNLVPQQQAPQQYQQPAQQPTPTPEKEK